MNISFNQHAVELLAWKTKKEMLSYLSGYDSSPIILGDDAEQEIEFFTAIIKLNYSAIVYMDGINPHKKVYGIGLISEGHGLNPHLLLKTETQSLLFGLNREVISLKVPSGEVSFNLKLETLFRSFLPVNQLSILLAFHDIGVVALNQKGEVLWKYEKDIITKCILERGNLNIYFMDSSPVTINLSNGVIDTSSELG